MADRLLVRFHKKGTKLTIWSDIRGKPLVSIIIVTFNNEHDILECVNSVLAQDYQNIELIIVDNDSADCTHQVLQQNFRHDKRVKVIASPQNTGYSGGNNLGYQQTKGDMIVVLNPDSVVDKSWLSELLKTYYNHEDDAGIVCSNVLLFDRPDVINACGNNIHVTGLVFSRFYGEHISKCDQGSCRVAAPSGASMMFSRGGLESIGRDEPFDSSRFFMEYSDIDLAVQFLKRGKSCYVAHSSKIFHKFKFKMNPRRMYFLETGRYQLLGHLTYGTIIRMLPSLILTEIIVWSFILSKNRKLIGPKLRANGWHLVNWPSTRRMDNSRTADMVLIENMTPDLVIYDEMKTRDSNMMKRGTTLCNKIFRFIRMTLIRSLRR